MKDIPVDIVRQVNIYFQKSGGLTRGLEILDVKGNMLIKAVTEENKSDPKNSFYSFSIGQGERIVGIRRDALQYKFVIGRKTDH